MDASKVDETVMDIVKEGDYIVVERQNFIKLHQLSAKGPINLGKDRLDLSNVIGKPVWTIYKMVPNGSRKREFLLEVCDRVESASDCVNREVCGRDNRNIVGDNKSQLLSTEDICGLRESGLSSTGIVTALIENSLSFKNKTEYSQEKYLKKKEKKYHEFITVRKPTLRILSEFYFNRDQFKVLGLRYDSLSQIISAANIQPGGRYLLYERGTQGLVGAAMLSYMSESSTLINLTLGVHPQRQAILAMNFPQSKLNCFLTVKVHGVLESLKNGTETKSNPESDNVAQPANGGPSNRTDAENETESNHEEPVQNMENTESTEDNVDKNGSIDKQEDGETKKRKLDSETEVERDDKRKRPKWMDELDRATDIIKKCEIDGLVIATKEYPLEIIDCFLKYIRPSRPLVIFSVFKEPLMELYMALKTKKNVLNMHLTETWLRNYQILPERTHPNVNMSPSSGYLLTATIVDP